MVWSSNLWPNYKDFEKTIRPFRELAVCPLKFEGQGRLVCLVQLSDLKDKSLTRAAEYKPWFEK